MKDLSTEKKFTNPLDELFETEQPTPAAVIKYDEVTEGALAELQPPAHTTVEKDSEDVEIDEKIDEVYTAAMDAFNTQTQYTEIVEPRYAARNAEVAANYLNIALNAASTRAKVKTERKKASQLVPFGGGAVGTGNTVVASREDIMRMISIDAEVKAVK